MAEVISSFTGVHFFLSNFFGSSVEYMGIMYPSVEHAFQAAKTWNVDDRIRIASASTPAKAKYIGRSVRLQDHWDVAVRYDVMRSLLREKFKNPILKRKLLETGNAILIEGNGWGDQTWGVSDSSGRGHNLLGWMLMDLRDELKPTMRGTR